MRVIKRFCWCPGMTGKRSGERQEKKTEIGCDLLRNLRNTASKETQTCTVLFCYCFSKLTLSPTLFDQECWSASIQNWTRFPWHERWMGVRKSHAFRIPCVAQAESMMPVEDRETKKQKGRAILRKQSSSCQSWDVAHCIPVKWPVYFFMHLKYLSWMSEFTKLRVCRHNEMYALDVLSTEAYFRRTGVSFEREILWECLQSMPACTWSKSFGIMIAQMLCDNKVIGSSGRGESGTL